MTKPGLRAKLRLVTYYHPTPEPVWEWTIPNHDEFADPWGFGSDYDLGRAIADANDFVHGILSDRVECIRRTEGSDDAECPECGDPCEYIEGRYPSGGWFTYSCESCGSEGGDSY